uniref:Uncharacterized protein n=1 Tax=Romanomermis culicivorax TaxID=13658 RepID=A0A915HR94_ROMCU
MEQSTIIEMDNNFGQPQEQQDNTNFILSNYNAWPMVCSTDIFNYFSSLFGGPHMVNEDLILLAPEGIKSFI